MMATTDIALITDPVSTKEISKRFFENPDQLADAFLARVGTNCCTATWGLLVRYLGPWVSRRKNCCGQDPVPRGQRAS